MKFSRKWLNEYVDIQDINLKELVDKLTLNSFEVESVEYQGESLKNIVVARIESVEKHYNDNLMCAEVSGVKVATKNQIMKIITETEMN